MPSLKEYRDRISGVKATKKITSAMKMVAAAKLKKAQDQANASHAYARKMIQMMARVQEDIHIDPEHIDAPRLLIGTGKEQTHLLVLITSDRGLCGGFNGYIVREARREIKRLEAEGKTVKLICIGRKGIDMLRREHGHKFLKTYTGITGRKKMNFADAHQITKIILEDFENGGFDVCTLIYNKFRSMLVQEPSVAPIIPVSLEAITVEAEDAGQSAEEGGYSYPYGFEPTRREILDELMPRNIAIQLFRALLDSAAGEQAARMTAMDGATRNAGEKVKELTLQYNRARQAYITKELIEIISGAEAV